MDEDMILPEGFESTPQEEPQAEEPIEQQPEVVEDIPTEQPTQEPTEQPKEVDQPKIKVKYNHEERELTLEEAALLAQKGMNYDKTIEKLKALETDPRLSFVEELARENNMTVDQYLEAVRQHKEQERLNQLIQQNIPEDIAKEILENRKFREQLENEKKTKASEEKRQAEFKEFIEMFSDVQADKIPSDVWEKNAQGVPLKYAYMEHQMNDLKTQIAALKQNETNKQKAPIKTGVSTFGSEDPTPEDPFLEGFNLI